MSMAASLLPSLSLAAQTQLHENFISLVCFCFTFLCFVVVAAAVDLIYWQHCCGRATVAPTENESVLVCMCMRDCVSVCMYVMQITSAKQQRKRKNQTNKQNTKLTNKISQ